MRAARDRGGRAATALLLPGVVLIALAAATTGPPVPVRTAAAVCPAAVPPSCGRGDAVGGTGGGRTPPGLPAQAGTTQGPPPPAPSVQPARGPRRPARFAAKEQTERVLAQTEMGRRALGWVRRAGVHVVYRPGGGSFFDVAGETFFVDVNQPPEERANTFVHETNHAQHSAEPDPHGMARADYVRRSTEEEARGAVLEIRNNQQIQRARGPGQVADTGLQDQYEAAYARAVRNRNRAVVRAGRPPLSRAEQRRVGEAAGLRRVMTAFYGGEVVTSTSGESYPDYYGSDWDDAHDCALWSFC